MGEEIATSSLKSSDGFTRPGPSRVVFVGYVVAFYFLLLALKSIPVGIAYAVWAGLGVVLVAAIGSIVHGPRLDCWTMLGLALIVGGVGILNVVSTFGTE